MTTARELMSEAPVCVNEADSVLSAAIRMADLDVGALPICGEDNKLHGMLTDRDIVVKVLARRLDPSKINAGQLAQGKPVTVRVDDDAEAVLAAMKDHRVRRLPVIEHGTVVGMIASADVARALDRQQSGELLQAVSS
jgi:CBS domain-containing protein